MFLDFLLSHGADVEPLQMNPDVEEGYCKAVLYRLRFRKVLSGVLIRIFSCLMNWILMSGCMQWEGLFVTLPLGILNNFDICLPLFAN